MLTTFILSLSLTATSGPFGETAIGETANLNSFPSVQIVVNTKVAGRKGKIETVRTIEEALTLCKNRVESASKKIEESGMKIFHTRACEKYVLPAFSLPGVEAESADEQMLATIYVQP